MPTIYIIDALGIVTTIHVDSNLDNNLRYAQDITKIFPRSIQDMPKIRPNDANHMPEICQRYA